MNPPKHKIICLCGQVKYKDDFFAVASAKTLAGNVVLMPLYFSTTDEGIPDEVKAVLIAVHNQKIDMADEILVINPEGVFGDDTRNEIARAEAQKKPVRYLVDL